MEQTIEERAYKAVPDMLRINDNYIASFVSGYCRGAIEERAKIKEYLEQKIKTLDSATYDSYWELLNEIINELFKAY